ncbi:hypothetical protein [Gorillibacterium sp. sgz5001074]|uniref:hypothetical protein n=1 Tax=Gorillibacterium sp. sgz5001074 TaxID=3446695 RepID=UPI003F6764A9
MITVPRELLAVAGMAVIGHLGESIITEMGKKTLATYWSITLYIASGIMTLKYFYEGTREIAAVFHVFF